MKIVTLTGSTNYDHINIDRPIEKIGFKISAKYADSNTEQQIIDALGLGNKFDLSVKISNNNGSNLTVCNNARMGALAEFGAFEEGGMRVNWGGVYNVAVFYIPVGINGDLVLQNGEKISIKLNNCDPESVIEIFTLENEKFTKNYFKYSQQSADDEVRHLSTMNSHMMIIEAKNFRELDINYVTGSNPNNSNLEIDEIQALQFDTNDIALVIINEKVNTGFGFVENAKHGFYKNYMVDVTNAGNVELHPKSGETCEFYMVEALSK